jgi:hypothetical protein
MRSACATGIWTDVGVTSLVGGNGTLDLAMLPINAAGVAFSSSWGASPPQLVVEFGGTARLDLWEIEAGLSPIDPTGANGAQGDLDGDGIANIDERRDGTDPFNPADRPAGRPICRLIAAATHSSCRL